MRGVKKEEAGSGERRRGSVRRRKMTRKVCHYYGESSSSSVLLNELKFSGDDEDSESRPTASSQRVCIDFSVAGFMFGI